MVHRFVRKLEHATRLTEEDGRLLTALAQPVRQFAARSDIATEGAEPRGLFLLVEGWACRYRLLPNGKRQILSVLLPGDLCEPFGVLPRFLDHAVGALTAVSVSPISLGEIGSAAQANPRISEALWWDLLMAFAVEREHLVSLGRRSATERMGHLICELHLRLAMVGLADGREYDMPVTQADLADVLGLSAVHINRALQELRRAGLISLRGRRLVVHDLDKLREFSAFDPAYLRVAVSSSLSTGAESDG